jgi:NADP-dependent 3-hydroxy acid dehydrogenase YdfG
MPDDKVFLITGASTGIGAATARHAAEAGYRVVLAARSEDRLRGLADELGGDDRALALRCDVTEWDDQQALVERTLDAYGRLDVAFANAGFGGARGFKSGTPEEWKEMVLTNVLRRRAHDPRRLRRARRCEGPPAADVIRRRPPRAPRLVLLRH